MDKTYIRSKHFNYEEIQTIIKQLKELNYEWIVDIDYIGSSDSEEIDVTFSVLKKDLGEFFSVLFSCGYLSAFEKQKRALSCPSSQKNQPPQKT